MFETLQGKRTYIIAFVGAVLGFYLATDEFTNAVFAYDLPNVPDALWALLAAAGVTTLRAAVSK